MTNEEIFAAWSPAHSPWSTWTKPVLFARLGGAFLLPAPEPATSDASWLPSPSEKTALVLDLPGEESVWLGLALAARGFFPVPLFNAVPLPFGGLILDPLSRRSFAAVNVLPIVSALRRGAEQLARMNIGPDAPPVFMLDANRHAEERHIFSDEFDNRSICFTTDFPSANFLLAHQIVRVLLVQRDRDTPRDDLAHVLRRWQEGGVVLERTRCDLPGARQPFQVNRPAWYGAMFQRALSAFGLRRAPTGGFGAWMADSSAGG